MIKGKSIGRLVFKRADKVINITKATPSFHARTYFISPERIACLGFQILSAGE